MKLEHALKKIGDFIVTHQTEILYAIGIVTVAVTKAKLRVEDTTILDSNIDIYMGSEPDMVIQTLEASALEERDDYYKNRKADKIVDICKKYPTAKKQAIKSLSNIASRTADSYYKSRIMDKMTNLI